MGGRTRSITPEQADEVRRRYAAGETANKISRELGLAYLVAVRAADPERYERYAEKDRERKRGYRRRSAESESPISSDPHDLETAKATWDQEVGQVWIEDRRVKRFAPGSRDAKAGRRGGEKEPNLDREWGPTGVRTAVPRYELAKSQEFATTMASIRAVLSPEALEELGAA